MFCVFAVKDGPVHEKVVGVVPLVTLKAIEPLAVQVRFVTAVASTGVVQERADFGVKATLRKSVLVAAVARTV